MGGDNAKMGVLSAGALLVNGAAYGLFVYLFLQPEKLFQVYGVKVSLDSAEGNLLRSAYRNLAGFCFVFSFLFLHFIPFTAKHSQGLRTALMLNVILLIIALHRYYIENFTAGWQSVVRGGVLVLISIVGMMASEKPVKTKSS